MFQIFKIPKILPLTKFCFVMATALLISQNATAQFADSPCDPGYYDSLEARAWLEAQREITQNQNLIYKPDSVLEYTCFDRHLYELAEHAEDMFSENTRWGGNVLGANQDTHMDAALLRLVISAFDEYDQANFAHNLLGGRVRSGDGLGWIDPPGEPDGATGLEFSIESDLDYDAPVIDIVDIGGSYTCSVMQSVWQRAKCSNFIDSVGDDGFFTFDEYAERLDPRRFPTACAQLDNWQEQIDIATPPLEADDPPWEFDATVTYLERLFPEEGCGAAATNKVKTGLVAFNSQGSPKYYNEHVCLVPGCYWQPTTEGGDSADEPQNGGECVGISSEGD